MRLDALAARAAGAGLIVTAVFLPVSIVGVQLGMGLMLAASAAAFALGRRRLAPGELLWPLGAFAAACVLATLVSPVDLQWKSWFGFRHALLVLLVPAALALSDRPERLVRRALVALLVAAALTALLGLYQRADGFDLNHALGLRRAPLRIDSPSGKGYAAIGTFNSRLTFSAVQSAIFVMAVSLAIGAKGLWRRTAAGGVALACALGVTAAFARAAWLGAFAGLAVLFVGLRQRTALALALVALLGIGAWAAIPSVRERAVSAVRTTANQDRLFIWSRAGEVLADHPVFGVGVYGYPSVAGPYYDQHDPHFPMRTWAHDMYLTLLVETGPAGLLAYVWLFVVVAAIGFGALRGERDASLAAVRRGALGATASLLVASLFHDVLYDGEAAMTLFFFAGLAASVLSGRNDAPEPPQSA